MAAKVIIACLSLALLAIQVVSFPQQLIFELAEEDSDGNTKNTTLTFRGPVSNTDEHPFFFNRTRIMKTCYQGYWNLYAEANFTDWDNKYHSSQLTCTTYNSFYKGFRSGGARETAFDAISLYDLAFYEGHEYYTEGPAFGGMNAVSYVLTGSSSWTFFNGTNFDGPTYCKKGNSGLYDWGEVSWGLPISQIGSVLKGCFSPAELAQKIQLYKK